MLSETPPPPGQGKTPPKWAQGDATPVLGLEWHGKRDPSSLSTAFARRESTPPDDPFVVESRSGVKRVEAKRGIKVVVLGDKGVGKSTLIASFAEEALGEGANVKLKAGERKTRVVRHDTSGEQGTARQVGFIMVKVPAKRKKADAEKESPYEGADGALIMYDVNREESFASISRWEHEV